MLEIRVRFKRRAPIAGTSAHSNSRVVLGVMLLVTCCCYRADAQSATATVTGHVRDETDAALPGVAVTASDAATGVKRTTSTDAEGRYRMPALEPGEYSIRIELNGFRSAVFERVALTVGGTTTLDVTLRLGQFTEEVNVVPARLSDEDHPALSRVVTLDQIEALPISGRNFTDFARLSSGVTLGRENVGGGPFKEPDSGIGPAAVPRLSFGGQSELHTVVQVDGFDNLQTVTGLPRATPSQEAVREFRVLHSTYLAEYGRALGGHVNIVTQSGSNERRGSAYYFGVFDELSADSALSGRARSELRQHQFGATLGGAWRPNELFYFGNYEGQHRIESNRFSTVILTNLANINAVRRSVGLRPETIEQLRGNDYSQAFGKIDRRANAGHTLSFRYHLLAARTQNFLGGGGRASPASSIHRFTPGFPPHVLS